MESKVDGHALASLGFSDHMTPAEAKAHAKKLNALSAIERKQQASQVKAAERLTDLITIERSIVPKELSEQFISHIEKNWYGGQYNLRKMILHWNLVQAILTKLKLQPHEFFEKKNDFYKHFEREKFSKSYVEKILKVVNAWGEFYSQQSKTYYKRIPNPKGIVLEAIVDASDADGLGAAPLALETLRGMKSRLPVGQWEYMRATLWLGLRPSDLDAIIEDPSYMKTRTQSGTIILSVYQPKLTSVKKEKRWKHIPLFHPEMKAAYQDIKNKVVDKPLVKTLKSAAPNIPTIGLYSGRKGFTDLMLSLDQTLENISLWLGHTSIERTWRNYKDKELVTFKPLKLTRVK